jgi:prophage antirepressor-like protein
VISIFRVILIRVFKLEVFMDSAIVQVFEPTKTEISFWVDEAGEDMMQAKGIFEALDLSVTNISTTLERHVDLDYRRQVALGRGMPAWFLTYEGLIQLAFATKAPRAKALQRWVSSVIKTIIKTGTYTATAADQQHFAPFGITLQIKIDECDRYIEAAQPTADIAKVLRNRKALEQAYKAQSKVKPVETEDELYQPIATLLAGRAVEGNIVTLEAVAKAVIHGTVTRTHELRVGKILRLLGYEKKRETTGARRRIFVKGT